MTSSTDLVLRGVTFRPARLLAPLAGITHSAFRRLVAELGGCGGFWTEMLAAKSILGEDFATSPYLRRRPEEPRLVYQLMVRENDPMDRIVGRVAEAGTADGIDLNLACHAPSIRSAAAGSQLFENLPALADILESTRRAWPGLLTVKIRLGFDKPGWQDRFAERMRLFESSGVDAVVLHPRFFEDKFKRSARHELYPWAASLTRLPLVANGDIIGPQTVAENAASFAPARGLMIGRMAACRPWVFAEWERAIAANPYAEVWLKLCRYIAEDFAPKEALVRITIAAKYYARNFQFGHHFHTAIRNSASVDEARERSEEFLRGDPAVLREPSLLGV